MSRQGEARSNKQTDFQDNKTKISYAIFRACEYGERGCVCVCDCVWMNVFMSGVYMLLVIYFNIYTYIRFG